MEKRNDLGIDNLVKYQNYIEDLYKESGTLSQKSFIDKTEWKDFVPVIEDDVVRFLKIMLQVKKPMKILEIGTSIGFSATSMALIAKKYGGTITTIEFNPLAQKQAEKNFLRYGVDKTVQIMYGDACKILPQIADESFDLIFQDVENRLYPQLQQDCVRILKTGGIFIADDTLFPVMDLGEQLKDQVEPTNQFNHMIANSSQLESTLLPIGDGVVIGIKR
ncbi:O-methyltransferase [Anaerosporobacter faecicola]|uniref:O-methyltransferase n=1 Tax=Anaerosporobacter faecicola TaxID=2718714 RepID=UPI00143B95BE|nr:O-methyltransferase [Anaerosporobacter faecicola]